MHVEVSTSRGIARVRVSHRDLKNWYLGNRADLESTVLSFCDRKINSFVKTGEPISVNSIVKVPRKGLIDWQGRKRAGLV